MSTLGMEDSSSRSGKGSTHLDQCGYCGGDIDEEDQEYVGCEEADRCHSPSDWFHLACAGLKEVPAEEVPWVCAECRKHKKGKRPVKRRKLDIDSDLSKVCHEALDENLCIHINSFMTTGSRICSPAACR